MLRSLSVNNYAIIEKLEISFSPNLTIITGETGAGKSILLGALSLILGDRADTSVLFDQDKKCIIEGIFDVSAYGLERYFQKEDLDYEKNTAIRREINASGKSRAFINDTPVKLSTLKKLTGRLVDIHAQHETLELMRDDFQMVVIDSIAENENLLSTFGDQYNQYKRNLKQLEHLLNVQSQASKDYDYYQFQLQEMEEANLGDIDEQLRLEEELNTLTNAEEIKIAILNAIRVLDGDERAVLTSLGEISHELNGVSRFSSFLQELLDRIESCKIELKDITQELENQEQQVTFDEQRIQEVNDRLSNIYKLQKKHQVNSIRELLNIKEELIKKTESSGSVSSEIERLQREITDQIAGLNEIATQLSQRRTKAIQKFEEKINGLVADVGLPKARIKVDHIQLPSGEFHAKGFDILKFLFSANPGTPLMEIRKAASGGELSRLMLIIKSLVAGSTALPTLIFDEIDAGISGEVGLKVGRILEILSKKHQVACITHLPQIASKGDKHFFVFKEIRNNKTYTKVKDLDSEERILEIAKMLSGEKPGVAAMENARELLSQ